MRFVGRGQRQSVQASQKEVLHFRAMFTSPEGRVREVSLGGGAETPFLYRYSVRAKDHELRMGEILLGAGVPRMETISVSPFAWSTGLSQIPGRDQHLCRQLCHHRLHALASETPLT